MSGPREVAAAAPYRTPKRSSLGRHCWFGKDAFDERYDGPLARGFGDDDSTGHACANVYALRNIIDMDPDRNTLGKPHPLESRGDIRQELRAIRIVSISDATTNTVDMPSQ